MRAAWTKWCALAALVAIGLATPHVGADEAHAPAPTRAPVELGRFSTSFLHDADHHARAFNVELAAESIDGKIIPPGGTFSFNDAVGARTAVFGFAKSVVLRNHMIAEGVGGGACQVASTLHAAALLAGLDIASRTPHSRPSAYIRMGLDATVVFPAVDLKIKNPRADRVVVHARSRALAGREGTLEVWLDGDAEARSSVSLTTEIIDRTPFARSTETNKAIPENTVRVKAFGIPGFRVRRTREVHAADGTIRQEVHVDFYPPTTEIVQVAPTFDVARLAPHGDDEPIDQPDAPAASAPPPFVRDSTGVVRPSLAQLRPSTRVALDNAPLPDQSPPPSLGLHDPAVPLHVEHFPALQ